MTTHNDASLYLSQDRRRAFVQGETLPGRATGSVLMADISGFTPLTAVLVQTLGSRRGAEELGRHLDNLYEALIAEVERFGGSVVSFAGDAITCWFAEVATAVTVPLAAQRAVACAQAMQTVMCDFAQVGIPSGETISLAMKTAVASGPAWRFVVGDPHIQQLDILAGNTLTRMAAAEELAHKGEVIIDQATLAQGGGDMPVHQWRSHPTGARFAVITSKPHTQPPPIWPRPVPVALPTALVKPWLPPGVYDQLQAGTGEFFAELRPVVALFLRFAGLDYDADDAAGEKLDAYIRWVQNIVAREDGVLANVTMGDKGSYLYIVYGAPMAHEDNARRAVSAALALQRLPSHLAFIQATQIGISQGMMRVGTYGGRTRRTYGALGDEVNVAARLMQAAAPGQSLVSSRAYKACRAAFHWDVFPPITVKGKGEPIPIFAPQTAVRQQSLRLFDPLYAAPMVGRVAELALALEKLDLARQGQGQILGITGEAGLGKSRLTAEIIRAARTGGFADYGGACQSEGEHTPYLVWRMIWRDFFAVDEDGRSPDLLQRLKNTINRLSPQRVSAAPLLGLVLGHTLPENSFTRSLNPKTRKIALHALLEDCLKTAAAQSPLLLVLDDVHFIDSLSHDLLEELGRAISRFPVCIVLAYRPPHRRSQALRVDELNHFTRLCLIELPPAEGAQIIQRRLAQLYPEPTATISPELVNQLTLRGQGNPFYLEELLNYLYDQGIDPYALENPDSLFSDLPDSLYALVFSRIDQLHERERVTLKVASIIGRSFRLDSLSGYYPALGSQDQITTDLEMMRQQEILLPDAPDPQRAYLFRHIITHDVVYDSMPYGTRARLHEAFAVYLEQTTHHALPLDLLAYHYERSENIPKRITYLRQAGEAAQAAYANADAIEYYLSLLPLLQEHPAESVQVYLNLGNVTQLLGRWEQAEKYYTTGLELAEKFGQEAEAVHCQLAVGKLQSQRSSYEAAIVWLERAHRGFERLGHRRGMSLALAEMGRVYFRQAEHAQATALLEESLALARQLGERADLALVLKNLGNGAWRQGQYGRARTLYGESLALYRQIGDKQGIAVLLNNLGNVLDDQGDYSAACAHYEESLAMCREIGDKRGISMALSNLGFMAWAQGDLTAARALNQEGLALEQELGEKWGMANSLNNLGSVAAEQGDYDAASRYFEEGLALSQEVGARLDVALAWCNLGEMAVARQAYQTARAYYEKSIRLAQEVASNRLVAYNLIVFAELALLRPLSSEQTMEQPASRAACLLAAARLELTNLGTRLNRVEQRTYDRVQSSAKAILGENAFQAAWDEGSKLGLETAVTCALQT